MGKRGEGVGAEMAVLELDEDDDAGGWDWDGVVDCFEIEKRF